MFCSFLLHLQFFVEFPKIVRSAHYAGPIDVCVRRFVALEVTNVFAHCSANLFCVSYVQFNDANPSFEQKYWEVTSRFRLSVFFFSFFFSFLFFSFLSFLFREEGGGREGFRFCFPFTTIVHHAYYCRCRRKTECVGPEDFFKALVDPLCIHIWLRILEVGQKQVTSRRCGLTRYVCDSIKRKKQLTIS